MEWDREQQHERKLCEEFVNRPSSPETERIFARFMTSGSGQPPSPNNTIHCSLLLRHSSSPARPFSMLWEDVTMLFQNQGSGLEGHLSLPDYSKSDELLRLSHSVPCKISAKRGCATHPRSIAERVRRTRISERIRKLQEHVPNIDKQANTSEMLDLAIEYIKDLQKQVQALSNDHKNCSCDKH